VAEDQNHKYLELSPGATIADYQVIRELGRGAMAVVYLAQQLNLARPVALKIMASALAEKPEFVSRFINEVRTAAALSHANIVQAFDAGVIDSRIYYFAMEYIDGETVLQKIKREGRLEVTEGLRIAIDIAGALNYGWQRHEFTHGDIKPENIMLTADGIPKLADFGLANARGHEYKGETMLTPHYAAPELIRGEQEGHSCLSDIYAFGASLYHILSGTTPYPGDNARTVMNRHLKDPLEPLIRREPSVPAVVSDFVGQMLAKSPAARPQDWEQVVQGLKTCLLKVEKGEGGTAAQAGISPKRLVVSQSRAQARRQVGAAPRKGRGILNILILLSVLVLAAVAAVLVFQKVQQQRIRRSLEGLPMDGDYDALPENGQIVPETDEESSSGAEEMVSDPEPPSTTATVNPPAEPEVASEELPSKQSQPEAKPDRPVPQPDAREDETDQNTAAEPETLEPAASSPDASDQLEPLLVVPSLKAADVLEINKIRLIALLTSLEPRNDLRIESDEQLLPALDKWREYPGGGDLCQEYVDFLRNETLPAFEEILTRLLLSRHLLEGKPLISSQNEQDEITVQKVSDGGLTGNKILGKGQMQVTMSWRQLAETGYLPEILRLSLASDEASASDLKAYLAFRLWSRTFNLQADSSCLQRLELLGESGLWREVCTWRLENRKFYKFLAERLESLLEMAANGARVEAARVAQEIRQKLTPANAGQEKLFKTLQESFADYSLEQQGISLIREGRKQRDSYPEKAICAWLAVKNCYAGNYPEYKAVDKLIEETLPKLNKGHAILRDEGAAMVHPFLGDCYSHRLPVRTWLAAQILLRGDSKSVSKKSVEALRQFGRLETGNWQAARKIDSALHDWSLDDDWARFSRAYAKILVDWRMGTVPEDWKIFADLPNTRYRPAGKTEVKPSASRLAPVELLTAEQELAHILGGKYLSNSYRPLRDNSILEKVCRESKDLPWRLFYLSMSSLLRSQIHADINYHAIFPHKRDNMKKAMELEHAENIEQLTTQFRLMTGVLPDKAGQPRVALGDIPVACQDPEAWLMLQVSSRLSPNTANIVRKTQKNKPKFLAGHPDDARFFLNCCDTYGRGWGPVGGTAIFHALLLRVNNELKAKKVTEALKLVQDVISLNLPCLAAFYPRLQFLLAGLQELSGLHPSLPDARSRVLACLSASDTEKSLISFADDKLYGELVVNPNLTGSDKFWQNWLAVCSGAQASEHSEADSDQFDMLQELEKSLLSQARRLKDR